MKRIKIEVNGRARTAGDGNSIRELLAKWKLSDTKVVVQVSGRIIGPEQFSTVKVREGDCLDIVSFVKGG